MIYSKTCEYAVRALGYLATKETKCLTKVPEVSLGTGVPGPYISKIFQCLVRQGLLTSKRGANGGFQLKKNPRDISMMDIVKAVDDLSPWKECMMGLDECSNANACPMHDLWERMQLEIAERFQETTLVDLIKDSKQSKYRETKRSFLNVSFQPTGS